MSRRGIFLALALAFTVGATGCKEIEKGTQQYWDGHYEAAIDTLEKVAAKYSSKDPVFKVCLGKNTTLEDVLPHLTEKYFTAWEAYAGSQLGLNRVDDACQSIRVALRPLTIKMEFGKKTVVSPWEGAHWSAPLFTLRSFALTIPCPL